MTRSELDAIAIFNHLRTNGSATNKQICYALKITPSRFQNCKVYLQRYCQREKLVWSIKHDSPPMTHWVGGNPFDCLRAVHSCSSADVAWVKK